MLKLKTYISVLAVPVVLLMTIGFTNTFIRVISGSNDPEIGNSVFTWAFLIPLFLITFSMRHIFRHKKTRQPQNGLRAQVL